MYNDLNPFEACLKKVEGSPGSPEYNKKMLDWATQLFSAQAAVQDNFEGKLYKYRKNPKRALIYYDGYSLWLSKKNTTSIAEYQSIRKFLLK